MSKHVLILSRLFLACRGLISIDISLLGQNYQDHVFFGITRAVALPTFSAALNNPEINNAWRNAYNKDGSGPLGLPFGGLLAWERLPDPLRSTQLSAASRHDFDEAHTPDWPELEYIPVSVSLGYNKNYTQSDPLDGKNYASLIIALNAPLSKGTISINSSHMSDPPVLDPGYLRHPGDREMLIGGFKRSRQLWAGLSNLTVGEKKIPGPKVQSDEEILKYITESLNPFAHSQASCKMGKRDDPMAVIDSQARVIGVDNLRVVDASSFPFLIAGHSMATIYALAEKIADDILHGR